MDLGATKLNVISSVASIEAIGEGLDGKAEVAVDTEVAAEEVATEEVAAELGRTVIGCYGCGMNDECQHETS